MSFAKNIKVKKISVQILLFILSVNAWSQGITAFIDYRSNFVVFDDGVFKTLEIQPIQRFSIGAKMVAYIDNLGYFKIYQNGKTHQVAYGTNIDFKCTDNLVTFYFNEQLWVFDNGEKKMLSLWTTDFKTSDYTVAFLDNQKNTFNIYQAGEIIKLEDVQTGINDLNYSIGENIIAYSYMNEFKVFYLGQNTEISFNNHPTSFEAGRNIVAYNLPREQTFNVFYKGENIKLEDFQPSWFKTGDNMVIYKDQLGNLKIFYDGQTKSLSNYQATQIDVQDNICSFVEQGQFKIFFQGELKILEYFVPNSKILDNNTVLYVDQTNSLKYFNGTAGEVITSERVGQIDLNINTISYQNSAGRNRVFYKGVLY
jgi:hypothetical protein